MLSSLCAVPTLLGDIAGSRRNHARFAVRPSSRGIKQALQGLHWLASAMRMGRGRHTADRNETATFQAEALACLDSLYRTALRLTRVPADAEDLVQDTYLKAFRAADRFEPGTNLKAWLFTTLHRRFLEAQRRIVRFPHLEIDEATEDLPRVEPALADQLDAQTVIKMLGKVDMQFQAAVALFYLEDYSYNEIAAILEIPLGTVKSRIARGIAQLRVLILKDPHNQTIPGEEPS